MNKSMNKQSRLTVYETKIRIIVFLTLLCEYLC